MVQRVRTTVEAFGMGVEQLVGTAVGQMSGLADGTLGGMRKAILGTVAVSAAAAATVALVIAVIIDVRKPDDCQSVASSLSTAITDLATHGPLTVLAATAVENPFARGRSSVPFDAYYLIGIRFQTPEGTNVSGIWGLGTNAARHGPEQTVAVVGPIDGVSSSLAAITPDAGVWTDWPNHDIPIKDSDPMVDKAMQCLSHAADKDE